MSKDTAAIPDKSSEPGTSKSGEPLQLQLAEDDLTRIIEGVTKKLQKKGQDSVDLGK